MPGSSLLGVVPVRLPAPPPAGGCAVRVRFPAADLAALVLAVMAGSLAAVLAVAVLSFTLAVVGSVPVA